MQKLKLNDMTEWWNTLSTVMKILWGITLASSLIFVIQTVMTFLGADTDGAIDSVDTDFGGADSLDGSDASDGSTGANLYTFRNLVNFCMGFGWTAILMKDSVKSTGILIFVSLLVGVGLVALVMLIFKWLSGMQQSGNINVFKMAAGCNGTCYLPIGAERSSKGKVQITINDAVREYDALTEGEAIGTGESITVVEVIDADTLLVEKQNSMII